MSTITTAARKFWNDEEGATMAEYALLLGLIAIALVGAVAGLRTAISGRFTTATAAVNATS